MAGIGIGASRFLKKTAIGGVAYGPYTTAFQSTVVSRGGSLTTNELTYLNTFETSLGSDITEFDRLWIHGLSNSVAARTSFVNPNSAICTAINSPTFTPGIGYTGDGVSSYLNSNYNPLTQGVKYQLNNASAFSYLRNGNVVGASFAVFDGAVGPFLYPDNNNAGPIWYVNNPPSDSFGTGTGKGFNVIIRPNSASTSLYKNGVINASAARASSFIPNRNVYILGGNYAGNLAWPCNATISVTGFGSANYNQLDFYNKVQSLGTSIGWAV